MTPRLLRALDEGKVHMRCDGAKLFLEHDSWKYETTMSEQDPLTDDEIIQLIRKCKHAWNCSCRGERHTFAEQDALTDSPRTRFSIGNKPMREIV